MNKTGPGRVLRAVVLVAVATTGAGCLDSIVSGECDEGDVRCNGARTVGEGAPDAGPSGTSDPDPDPDPGSDPDPDPDPGSDPDPGTDPDPDPDPVIDPEPELECPDPLFECHDECVDLSSDPRNCGGCGVVCESGICTEGVCQDGWAGHVVVIGHDFHSQVGALERVLGNAVFLAVDPQPQVVVYTEHALGGSVARAGRAIDQHAAAIGRSWTPITVTDDAAVPAALAQADVLLVHDQPTASTGQLAAIGSAWQDALVDLTARGGVVIVLDSGENGGTHQVLAPSGLFPVAETTVATGEVASVSATTDAVAVGVPLHYMAPSRSVSFATETSVAVVRATSGQPIVVHRSIE